MGKRQGVEYFCFELYNTWEATFFLDFAPKYYYILKTIKKDKEPEAKVDYYHLSITTAYTHYSPIITSW